MVKRITILLCMCALGMQGIVGAKLSDSFSFLQKDPLYAQFVYVVRTEGSTQKAEQIRLLLVAQQEQGYEHAIREIRANTTLARLYVEEGSGDGQRARTLLEEAEQRLKPLAAQRLFSLILGSEIDGVWYLMNPKSLGKGISSSRQINKAYKEFPQEVSSQMLKANSLLYAPALAGGDTKKALNMFLGLLKDAEPILSSWDRASLYSGIGIACYKLKDYENAKGYLASAKAIYPFDAVLDEYIALVGAAL